MAFSDYRSHEEVAIKYGLNYTRDMFVRFNDSALIDEHFRREIDFVLKSFAFERSEAAAAESLIFPILKEVWKSYLNNLTLLSHEPLQFDEDLKGVADYIVCK